MEQKRFTETESLSLIAQMIASTHEKLERGGGRIFLLWGYVSIAVALAVTASLLITGSPNSFWLWFGIPVIGYPAMYAIIKNTPKQVQTYMDRVISAIWIVLGGSLMLLPFVLGFSGMGGITLFIMALVLNIGVMLTGAVIKFRPLVIGGVIGMLLTYAMPFLPKLGLASLDYTILVISLFIVMIVVCMIIPGHILNYRGRKDV